MLKKLNDLQFVIGLFFTMISLILLLSVLLGNNSASELNTYTGGGFLIFGLAMMFIKGRKQ
ncbi:hypothetical protein [Longitalea luteola]|uniref:hypothetical protein n=1 Tax=Longitalea luteola TaxID=2812563 RepID=UPI001A972EA7|nr:hypothetical protein [Longitalea luteola]